MFMKNKAYNVTKKILKQKICKKNRVKNLPIHYLTLYTYLHLYRNDCRKKTSLNMLQGKRFHKPIKKTHKG